jgi:hypothetical protein
MVNGRKGVNGRFKLTVDRVKFGFSFSTNSHAALSYYAQGTPIRSAFAQNYKTGKRTK